MPQGTVRRGPGGKFAGRNRGRTKVTTRSRPGTRGRNVQRRTTWRDVSATFTAFRWRNVTPTGQPRKPRKPKVPSGHLSTKRIAYRFKTAHYQLRKHKRMAAAWTLGLGTAELAGWATLRGTGLALGTTAAILSAIAIGTLSRTEPTTRRRTSTSKRS